MNVAADDLERSTLARQPSAIYQRVVDAFGQPPTVPTFDDGRPDVSLATLAVLEEALDDRIRVALPTVGPKKGDWADSDAIQFLAFVAHSLIYRGRDVRAVVDAVAQRATKLSMLWGDGKEPSEAADLVEQLAF